MSLIQKVVLVIAITTAILLVAIVTKKKISMDVRRNMTFFEMIANVSSGLDKLNSGFDDIIAKTQNARTRLKQLGLLHKENLIMCALLRDKRTHENEPKH